MLAESPLSRFTFASSRRINHSLTAATEQRLLRWLATRAPRWLTSDQLTLLGVAAQVAAGICYALARNQSYWLLGVNLCLALNWLGDSLDGTLARVRCQQRPRYGFYVDHMVDVFGSIALMGGLACSGLVHPPIAIAMLIAFLVLAAESFLATHTLGEFQLSTGIFGPTEIRILLAIGNFALLRSPFSTIAGHRWLLFDVGGAIATACMFGTALITTLRNTARLYRGGASRMKCVLLLLAFALLAPHVQAQTNWHDTEKRFNTDCAYENVFTGPSITSRPSTPTFTTGVTFGQYFANSLGKGAGASPQFELGVVGPIHGGHPVDGLASFGYIFANKIPHHPIYPFLAGGYTRMFVTGNAVNFGVGVDFGKDEFKKLFRIEVRDYYLFTGPQQHVIGLRLALGRFISD